MTWLGNSGFSESFQLQTPSVWNLTPTSALGWGRDAGILKSKESYKETRHCAGGEVSWPSLPAWVHAAYIPLSLMLCPQVPCHSARWENTAAYGSAYMRLPLANLSSSPMLSCLLLDIKAKQETEPQGKFRALNARTHLGVPWHSALQTGPKAAGQRPPTLLLCSPPPWLSFLSTPRLYI